MSARTLGLDLGPNSIGWALVDEANCQVIDVGVRVFPEGVANFDTGKEVSRSEQRRIARGMRRQISRRAKRKRILRAALVQVGLFPDDEQQQVELLQSTNPYELRARAISEKLSRFELGRVFLHLNQRRGFLSNRKRDRDDKEVDALNEVNDAVGEVGGP